MTAAATTLRYDPYFPLAQSAPDSSAIQRGITTIAGDYTLIRGDTEFGRHFAKLKTIRSDPSLWPEGAEAPKPIAFYWAAEVLEKLAEDMVRPSRVVATAEGGIAICFAKGDIYADVECFNDGTILGVVSDRRERPTIWEINPRTGDIPRAAARIRKFFATHQT